VRVRLTVNSVTTPVAPVVEPAAESRKEQKRAEAKKPAPVPEPERPAVEQPERIPAAPAVSEDLQPENDPLLDHTEAVISRMLHLLNLEAQVSAHYGATERDGRRNIHVDIRGKDLSVLIGRRSETLSAFQYIASLIVGKETQQFVQLVVDVEGYRDRREKQLIQMAKRMADQVAKSGRRQTLEPMPSSERRIIHIALRDHPDVKTESTGEEPYRKVVIMPKEG
jgi:spoIIIJ-associated protein